MNTITFAAPDWVRCPDQPLPIPASPEALRAGGIRWLTRALRTGGALSTDNSVVAITRFDELAVGGSGKKILLSLAYAREEPGLPHDLFVKFSRNFDDPLRDRSAHYLDGEVKLALLSRQPGFPVSVAKCLFAAFEPESETGMLITDRIAYGQPPIEPHHPKCMDSRLPRPLDHYRAVVAALARLAGSFRSGRMGAEAAQMFPLNKPALLAEDRSRFSPERLAARARKVADFVTEFPQLFPANVANLQFLEAFATEAPRYLDHEDEIKQFLLADDALISLCHFNANIDNAWFWQAEGGALECGLIDWGRAGQMHLALALWGCLSAASPQMWDKDCTALLELFVAEYAASGGPAIDAEVLALHLDLHVMMMGLAWLMDAPYLIRQEIPDPSVLCGPDDALFAQHETARVQLNILANVLNRWERRDLGRHVRGARFAPGLSN